MDKGKRDKEIKDIFDNIIEHNDSETESVVLIRTNNNVENIRDEATVSAGFSGNHITIRNMLLNTLFQIYSHDYIEVMDFIYRKFEINFDGVEDDETREQLKNIITAWKELRESMDKEEIINKQNRDKY